MSFGGWLGASEGRRIDVDGDGSFDCVDVAESWASYVYPNVPRGQLLGYGNAKALYRAANPQYFDKLGVIVPNQGDIPVWGGGTYGHIAVVIQGQNDGMLVLEENTYTQQPATRAFHVYNGFNLIGFLRPKVLEEQNMPTVVDDNITHLVYNALLHREPEGQGVLDNWRGKPLTDMIQGIKNSDEWLTQNDILLRESIVDRNDVTNLYSVMLDRSPEDSAFSGVGSHFKDAFYGIAGSDEFKNHKAQVLAGLANPNVAQDKLNKIKDILK